jgi:hypothetical protein
MAWSFHNGLGVCRFGQGEPIFLMPKPHRFARSGLPMTDSSLRVAVEPDVCGDRNVSLSSVSVVEMHCAFEAETCRHS